MRATYCKEKNTYTTEACKNCNCSEYQKQGVGSLVGQSTNVISKVDTEHSKTTTSVSEDSQSVSNITKINTKRTINS